MTTSDKLLAVLKLFTVQETHWSVAQAAHALDLPVSTTYRFFKSLANAGLISPFASGSYVLGPSISRLDRQQRLTDPLLKAARPELARIAAAFDGRVVAFLCRLFKTDVICVHQECGKASLAIGYERGRPMPLFRGSASKVILAHLPARQLHSLYRSTPREFATAQLGETWTQVKVRLQAIRSAGHCITTGEVDTGIRGISVPLFLGENKIIGSFTAAGRRRSLSDESSKEIVTALNRAAVRIERQLVPQIAAHR